jgi:hypothetical protein
VFSWPWKWFIHKCDTPVVQGTRCRGLTKLSAGCEALDYRQLMSTVAPVAAEFSVPSAALVANASTILESLAPKAFAQFRPPSTMPSSSRMPAMPR